MAPPHPSVVIDLSSDDDIARERLANRSTATPLGTSSSNSVSLSGGTATHRPHKQLLDRSGHSKKRNRIATKLRAESSKPNPEHKKLNNPPTSLVDQKEAATMKQVPSSSTSTPPMYRGVKRRFESGALRRRRGTPDTDSSGELPVASSFVPPPRLKASLDTATSDPAKPQSMSKGVGSEGPKRLRDEDLVSHPPKRRKIDVRNLENRSLSLSGSVSKPSAERSASGGPLPKPGEQTRDVLQRSLIRNATAAAEGAMKPAEIVSLLTDDEEDSGVSSLQNKKVVHKSTGSRVGKAEDGPKRASLPSVSASISNPGKRSSTRGTDVTATQASVAEEDDSSHGEVAKRALASLEKLSEIKRKILAGRNLGRQSNANATSKPTALEVTRPVKDKTRIRRSGHPEPSTQQTSKEHSDKTASDRLKFADEKRMDEVGMPRSIAQTNSAARTLSSTQADESSIFTEDAKAGDSEFHSDRPVSKDDLLRRERSDDDQGYASLDSAHQAVKGDALGSPLALLGVKLPFINGEPDSIERPNDVPHGTLQKQSQRSESPATRSSATAKDMPTGAGEAMLTCPVDGLPKTPGVGAITSTTPFRGEIPQLGAKTTDGIARELTNQERANVAALRPELLSLPTGMRTEVTKGDEATPVFDGDIGGVENVDIVHEEVVSRQQAQTGTVSAEAMSALGLAKQVELVLGRYLEKMRGDNEYWNRNWLKQARLSLRTSNESTVETSRMASGSASPPADMDEAYSFAALKPLPLRPAEKGRTAGLTTNIIVEKMASAGGKPTKKIMTVPVALIHPGPDMPEYAHAVAIKSNILASNVKTLHSWPYFGDGFDFGNAEGLKEQYKMDIAPRPEKLRRMLQAQHLDQYAESALQELGLTWDDVLRFLLEAEPDVGDDADAKQALRKRDETCEEDFSRTNERAAIVLSSLKSSTPERLGKAAVLCESFHRMAPISLWHVTRRHQFDKVPSDPDEGAASLDAMTCRICLRFDCPYHGEIKEHNDSDEEDSSASVPDDDDVIQTDIIHPAKVNYRTRVAFPPAPLEQPVRDVNPMQRKDRRTTQYWQTNYEHDAGKRKPFIPCHHPGTSCKDAKCSCFASRLPCEKTCSCRLDCPRKFQGCACSSEKLRRNQKLMCFEDDRCVCHSLGRECDPDLCGLCGVCEVLDPVNRYRDEVMASRCRNGSIQRGLAKRTLLGESGIHGFGLYAGEDINQHDFVGEYKGEIITKEEAERRGAVYEFQRLSYLFSLNETQEIDSTYFGNKIRFINHAETIFNLYPRIFLVNTVHRIALYADRPIKKGEELLFNYGPQFPDEQLGGDEPDKSAPRVRNSKVVTDDFYEVEMAEDELGNARARKAVKPRSRPKKSEKGKSAARLVENDDEAAVEVDDSHVDDTGPGAVYSADANLTAFYIARDGSMDPMDIDTQPGGGGEDDDVFEPDGSEEGASEGSEESEVADLNEQVVRGRFRKAGGRPPGGRRSARRL